MLQNLRKCKVLGTEFGKELWTAFGKVIKIKLSNKIKLGLLLWGNPKVLGGILGKEMCGILDEDQNLLDW